MAVTHCYSVSYLGTPDSKTQDIFEGEGFSSASASSEGEDELEGTSTTKYLNQTTAVFSKTCENWYNPGCLRMQEVNRLNWSPETLMPPTKTPAPGPVSKL